MGDINNNEPERFLTAADALELFKRLQIEERIRKDEERHGSELPLEISEYLDSTPTYELKEKFTRFKKQVARSGRQTPTKLSPLSINTQRTLEYKQEQRQKSMNNFAIYKEKFNSRISKIKRSSMKPLIKLPSLQRSGLDRLSSKTMMLETMPQKPLNYQPACNTRESSLKRIEQKTPLTKDLWQTSTKQDSNNVYSTTTLTTISNMDVLMEEEDIGEQTEVTLDSTQDLSLGIFTREGTAVGIVSPLQPAIQTLPLTTINSNNVTTTITTTTTTTTNTTTTTATTDTTYSTELLDSSRWHPSRGSPDQILQQLEENNQTPMAIETNPGGMPDSICKDSKAMVLAKKIYPRRRTKGNKYCRRKIPNCRNNRKVYRSKSKRLPFQVFHPSGSHQEKTNSGLSQVQPIYPGRALQDGRSISLERPNRAKRLHDDICILSQDPQDLQQKAQREYLGFEFNTKKMTIRVPNLKINKLMQRIKQVMTPTVRTCRWMTGLIGKITAMIPAVGEALLHIRHIQRSLSRSLSTQAYNWEGPCHLDQQSVEELQWWKTFLTKKNGLPIQRIALKKPQITITTDSSDTGWGVNSPIIQTVSCLR
ncbi:hypothetical protein G6F47_002260 [Rhizopus delemar]|nr:hypothetical protein G6F49_001844 [Rhizopus delemar]KAG1595775.1 hypothetical protein G6F48_000454 [Rhizopus delemar]KAG1602995.1 hypothetical protein G6F47_002260 [Rhizopus delemar]KAG1646526.1 hypothetical protein G6F44_000760 [Rhizopus delemar]